MMCTAASATIKQPGNMLIQIREPCCAISISLIRRDRQFAPSCDSLAIKVLDNPPQATAIKSKNFSKRQIETVH
jgi:hypothetical protein